MLPDSDYFLALQTQTGWGKVLTRFVAWIRPRRGWLALDVGCGPGLVPALLARAGCRALGVDLALEMFRPQPLHPLVAVADVYALPFPAARFDLLTASNLLFLLPNPADALREMARTLRPGGQIALLNPSEHLSEAAAREFADRRGLQGLARDTLINWGRRADAHHHWDENQLQELFAAAGLILSRSTVIMGPGFARLALGGLT